MSEYTNNDYLTGVLHQDSRIIKRIYEECFPLIRKMIMQFGGDPENAKDIFQDTLIMIHRKTQAGEMKLCCKFSTYFYGVSKKMWLQEIKERNRRSGGQTSEMDIAEEPEYINDYKIKAEKTLQKHFLELSPDCRKILRMHFNKATIDEIHAIMGYQSRHHTIDRKYRCKRSLIKRIINDPYFKNLKNEYSGQN